MASLYSVNVRHTAVAVLTVLVAAAGLSACGSGSSKTLTIQADYLHDDFTGSLWGFFPNQVTVRPGMTLRFHQTWTGEAHTVTMGTLVTRPLSPRLPQFFTDSGVNQAAAQPCVARSVGDLPLDGSACKQRELAPFRGNEAYYSSGFIPFEGVRGNTFDLKIAKDAKPGTYLYYCNLHGAPMGGEITVTRSGDVSKQAALNRQGKKEADRLATTLLEVYREEKAGNGKFKGNLAGSGDERTQDVFGKINEFTPRTIRAQVGEKVTWTMIGHNLSFNVPTYAPIYIVNDSGEVAYNESLKKPAGGWPGRTPPLAAAGTPPKPVSLDAGTFDGSGFKSNGTGWAKGDKYSITFTKKGTYPYACIVHPGMLGKVVVA